MSENLNAAVAVIGIDRGGRSQAKLENAERWESAMPEHARAATPGHDGSVEHDEFLPSDAMQTSEDPGDLLPTVATVTVVGIGAAIFEAAILPGLVLGVAAMCVPRFYPQIGSALRPLFKSTVRAADQIRQKTREMLAEAQEQVQDIVAEVDAEKDQGPSG
jgi:hypothetical protein